MNKIDEFAYESGLLCDGTPDSFDSKAIETFAELIVSHILNLVQDANTSKFVYTTYDRDIVEAVKQNIIQSITNEYAK